MSGVVGTSSSSSVAVAADPTQMTVMTGPYEEMMKTVKCPDGLKRRLCGVWMKRKKAGGSTSSSNNNNKISHSYNVLKDVLSSLEGGEGEALLCDTLYRYLVLLYSTTGECQRNLSQTTSSSFSFLSLPPPPEENYVFNRQEEQLEKSEFWRVVKEMCWEETRGREAESSRQQFYQDSMLWNLSFGSHPTIMRFFDVLFLTHSPPSLSHRLIEFACISPISLQSLLIFSSRSLASILKTDLHSMTS
jgi:hypothetical protein